MIPGAAAETAARVCEARAEAEERGEGGDYDDKGEAGGARAVDQCAQYGNRAVQGPGGAARGR